MSLVTPDFVLVNEKGKWIDSPAPKTGDIMIQRTHRTIFDIWLFYANIIDYVRVIMGFFGFYYTAHYPEYHWTIAFLIFGNVLLDWVDGPVARYMGQSSVFGSGVDWLADVIAQVNILLWVIREPTDIPYFTTLQIILTLVEITNGIFDFATIATGIYPSDVPKERTPWWAWDICAPFTNANPWCIPCWLANTLYPIAVIMKWHPYVQWILLPQAWFYAWHECITLVFILQNWQERQSKLLTKEQAKAVARMF
jgi:hypothetical protein